MLNWLHNRSKASPAPRTRLDLEPLDERAVPAVLNPGLNPPTGGAAIVYTESNNPQDGLNEVLAFKQNARTGALTQIGAYATGGTGELNVPKVIGPDDGSQQVQATADNRFLFAVNEGSNNVSAFRILANGGLQLIGTFASGGDQPDSIGIAGNTLYIANRGNATQTQPGTINPNVTAFNINRDGSLIAIPNSTVNFPVGTFVTQTLVSPDNRFLFVEAATLAGTPGGNTVTTFAIGADGRLTEAPGGPASSGTNAPILLGAAVNPNYNIVYTGFTSSGQVGVFTYDETGRTTFVTAATDSGAGPCWCAISPDGRVLYVANTGSDAIAVFSLADPLHPVQIQELQLAGPTGTPGGPSTNAFEIAISPTGNYLYAITQSTDPSFPQGNQLHTLVVARDGTLSEPTAPVIFSQAEVPADAHPQGVAVVQLGGRFDDSVYIGDDPFGHEEPGHFRDVRNLFRDGLRFGGRR